MKIYSTNEIRKIIGATQEMASRMSNHPRMTDHPYVHDEAAHSVQANQEEVFSLIAELEFDSKFEELLHTIQSRLPRL